ncbi:MAG: hypothetical protein K9L62_02955 [Vallitaleaceae bacterium]|nr:hypothetical protein [Vallitaleaceae bacterium]
MRKFLTILLCAAIIFSLSGCAKSMTPDEKAAVIKELSSNAELDELQTLYMTLDCFMEPDEVKSAIENSGLIVDEGSTSIKCGYDPSAVNAIFGLKGDFLKVEYSGSDVTTISYYSYSKNLTLTDNLAFSIKFPDLKEERYDTKKDQFEFLISYANDDFEKRNKIAVAAHENWLNPVSPEEKAKEEAELAKTTAIVLDGQIFQIVTNSQKNTQLIQDGMSLVSQGKGDLLELYNLAKTVKSNQLDYFSSLTKLQDDNNKDYIIASQIYVSNGRSLAESLMKYIDKQEMKYLSDIDECSNYSGTYFSSVTAERTKYLTSQGLTNEEVSGVLSSSDETTN